MLITGLPAFTNRGPGAQYKELDKKPKCRFAGKITIRWRARESFDRPAETN